MTYYASLVDHYTVQGLNRSDEDQTSLWLLCFIQQRYEKMLDNLTTMFIQIAKNYEASVAEKANELFLAHIMEPTEKDQKTAQLLRTYTTQEIDLTESFGQIRHHAYETILPAERINEIADELENKNHREKTLKAFNWPAVDALANHYKLSLRILLKVIPLESTQHLPLQKAATFLRDLFKADKAFSSIKADTFPLQFITAKNKAFIYDAKTKLVYTDRYEYECYRQLAHAIHGCSMYVQGSNRFSSLESQLCPNWKEEKEKIITQLDNAFLRQPFSQFIEEKAKLLDEKIIAVNEAIKAGENAHIKIKQHKDSTTTWTLPYEKKSLDLNNPIYAKLPPVSIFDVLHFANQKVQFMECFSHIKPHYAKSKRDEMTIDACLVARGTGLGLIKMAQLCDLSYQSLATADSNFLRLSTLRAANNRLINEIAKLINEKNGEHCVLF